MPYYKERVTNNDFCFKSLIAKHDHSRFVFSLHLLLSYSLQIGVLAKKRHKNLLNIISESEKIKAQIPFNQGNVLCNFANIYQSTSQTNTLYINKDIFTKSLVAQPRLAGCASHY